MFEALTPIATKREIETNAKIVILMKAGLAETKHCHNEQKRQEFHIGLSYVMPPREGEHRILFSRHQTVAQQSGGGYVRTHVPRVDTGR